MAGLWLGGACGAQPCHDADGDGRGLGCARGPDCNDHDPLRGADCDAAVPDCDASPSAPGCPCLTGEASACYEGAAETLNVGPCRGGVSSCAEGTFGSCDGEVIPTPELCNDLDDDCDGIVDEGVRSPCGGCNAACVGGVWGPPLSPFLAQGDLDVTEAGELTLRRITRNLQTLWVPNTDEGTVSKIDTDKDVELARYRTALGSPIRVAVDHAGDAWFLDGSVKGQAMLTKIAGDVSRCAAVSGSALRTSHGPSDVRALGSDDCVVLRVPVGAKGDDARALAVDGAVGPDGDPAGQIWVGLAHAHAVVELDGATGKQLARVALPGVAPYAAAFGPWGDLWLIDRAGLLVHIDQGVSPPAVNVKKVPFACYALESLAIDPQGRILLSGGDCESVFSYDPVQERFRLANVPDLLTPRGISMRADEAWVALDSGELARVTQNPLRVVTTFPLAKGKLTPYEAAAIATDGTGRVWVASALGGTHGNGLVTGFDPVHEQVMAQLSVGQGPRALGDMTGVALGGELVPEAQVTHVFSGCGHESTASDAGTAQSITQWKSLHIGALVGPDAQVLIELRHAADTSGLSAAKYETLGELPRDATTLPVELPAGGAIELRLTLRAHGAIGAPRVSNVGLEWTCPGPE